MLQPGFQPTTVPHTHNVHSHPGHGLALLPVLALIQNILPCAASPIFLKCNSNHVPLFFKMLFFPEAFRVKTPALTVAATPAPWTPPTSSASSHHAPTPALALSACPCGRTLSGLRPTSWPDQLLLILRNSAEKPFPERLSPQSLRMQKVSLLSIPIAAHTWASIRDPERHRQHARLGNGLWPCPGSHRSGPAAPPCADCHDINSVCCSRLFASWLHPDRTLPEGVYCVFACHCPVPGAVPSKYWRWRKAGWTRMMQMLWKWCWELHIDHVTFLLTSFTSCLEEIPALYMTNQALHDFGPNYVPDLIP